MFAGIDVFDAEPLTETTAAIPVNALELALIVIAVVGIVMEANKLQSWKALAPMEVTLAGIIIVGNDVQPWKELVPMEVILEPIVSVVMVVLP